MKQVHVVCAVIRNGRTVLSCQRGYGEYQDGWEFPGGKIESGESGQQALMREIREELNVGIIVDQYIDTVSMSYERFDLIMDCYLCHITDGDPVLLEHENMKWLTMEQIHEVDWLPADLVLIDSIKQCINENS